MKAAIFAHGRGSFAYTAGRLCSHRQQYDITAGSGNGALLAAFAACAEYDMLHDFILMTQDEEFYSKSPMLGSNNMSIFSLLTMAMKRRSLHQSIIGKLAPYFEKELSPMYYRMMTKNKTLCLSIYNTTRHVAEMKKIPQDIAYDRFSKFMLASISHPMVFPSVKIGKNYYRSAAAVEPLPIAKIIDQGATDIDIYVNLPIGSLDFEPDESVYYSLQVLDDNSRYLQLKEVKGFLSKIADDKSIKYRVFFIPLGLSDAETVDVNKYFDKGYIASDLLCSLKG